MTFIPRESVRTGLDSLAVRLEPIIADGLVPKLASGRPWTSVLTELDAERGRSPRHYNPADVQSQLRVLTERLGKHGFPFDTPSRLVSTLGNELRIIRNAEKHYDELTAMDAWRTHDCCFRLLDHFGDSEGAAAAAHHREAAIAAVVMESGASPTLRDVAEINVPNEGDYPTTKLSTVEIEHIEPDALVLKRDDEVSSRMIGSERLAFDPWIPVPVGEADVLDNVARKVNKDRVRAAASEIVEFEGPIHMDRLVQMVAASFAVSKLTARRRQKIERQVNQLNLLIDSDGFIWPSDLDPATWTEFRPNSSSTVREFLHVSPVEIVNAMRFVGEHSSPEIENDVDAATLRTFGRKKRTKEAASHLAKARKLLES
jgi:hypothetical protein